MRMLTGDQALAGAMYHHSLSQSGSSIEGIAADLVGLHNTNPTGPYLSLLARLPGFVRGDLDDVMWDRWRLARMRAMRLTMFVLPHELLEIAAAATRHFSEPFSARWLRDSGISQREFDRLAAAVEDALSAGPRTARGLRAVLEVPQSVDLPGVISRMCDTGRLVGGAPPRTWRSGVRQYHRWRDVLPGVDLHRWDETMAIRELVLRYVRSYGPVTTDDISWWTGITKGRCRAALDDLAGELEEVAVDGWPGPLFRIADAHGADGAGDDVKALPILDPYVQGYRDRIRFLDPGRHHFVYDGGGNATATLVHRGRIVGVWQICQDPSSSVRYHLFARESASERRSAEAALAAAGAMYCERPVDVVEIETMRPLNAGGGRSASHPLDSRVHRASRRNRSTEAPL